jgi:uncharacterized pyridoxamine 5'-phosphate oxidase family protein
VYESEIEVSELQVLLDRSMGNAGSHVKSIFDRRNWLSARQVCSYLQGVRQVAAATSSSSGEPRVAPIDAVFFHGKFCLSSDSKSLRVRHLAARPSVSLTYFESADPVIIVHGRATFIQKDDTDFQSLDSEWVKAYGKSILELSLTVEFIRVEPKIMLAYALHPERFQGP